MKNRNPKPLASALFVAVNVVVFSLSTSTGALEPKLAEDSPDKFSSVSCSGGDVAECCALRDVKNGAVAKHVDVDTTASSPILLFDVKAALATKAKPPKVVVGVNGPVRNYRVQDEPGSVVVVTLFPVVMFLGQKIQVKRAVTDSKGAAVFQISADIASVKIVTSTTCSSKTRSFVIYFDRTPTVDDKVQKQGDAALGQSVFNQKCKMCHTLDSTKRIGPPLNGFFGSRVKTSAGKSFVVDESYFLRALMNPAADVRAGYPPAMPRFNLSEDELQGLSAFIQSKK